MKRVLFTLKILMILLGLAAVGTARAQNDYMESAYPGEEYGDMLFDQEELADLLAPIALYPDPILAQLLPAATFIEQIDEAARYLRQYGNSSLIDDQPWDVSVRAIAHYPDILFMMDRKYDWTASLGQAFINQEEDVMDAIQGLRAEAMDAGNLSSTPQQEVVVEGDYIRIIPARPEVIYVPQYDPVVVYVERSPSFGFITFGIGLTIGAWLDRDLDWHDRRVFYHGWQGGGWISRSRPHIHDRRNIYINRNVNVINVNRRVIRRNTVNFRYELRRNARLRRPQPLPPPSPTRPTQPPPTRPRPVPTAGGTGGRGSTPVLPTTPDVPPVPRPADRDIYRGREIRGARPAARSGYGGYGNEKDAEVYRDRGRSSRGTMGRINRQQPKPAQGQGPMQNPRPVPIKPPPAATAPPPAPKPAIMVPRPEPKPVIITPRPEPKPAAQPSTRGEPSSKRGEGEDRRRR